MAWDLGENFLIQFIIFKVKNRKRKILKFKLVIKEYYG